MRLARPVRERIANTGEEGAMARLDSPHVVNIEDLRRMARRRLPRAVFDYMDGGAGDEVTLRENCRAFQEVILRPRHAVALEKCDLRTRVLGHDISFPAILAPVGYSRLMHPEGELAAARAAGEFGTVFILSTVSGHKLENVKTASTGPVWYQLYMMGGREVAEAAIERARAAGYSALVITIDTAIAGMRERDIRNGVKELLGGSLLAKIPFVPDVLMQPHNASLGLTFYDGKMFPKEYQGDLFAAEHGSWNRTTPSGHELVRVPLNKGKSNGVYEDFMTFPGGDSTWGRPVGVVTGTDGALYVTDDTGNKVWRISVAK